MRLRLFFKKKKIFFILKKSRKNFKNRFSQSRFGSIKELYVILKNFKMFRQSVYSRLANLYAFNKITSMSVCFIIFFLKNPSKFFLSEFFKRQTSRVNLSSKKRRPLNRSYSPKIIRLRRTFYKTRRAKKLRLRGQKFAKIKFAVSKRIFLKKRVFKKTFAQKRQLFFRKKLNFAFPLRFITKLKFFLGARYLNFFHNLLINSKRITGSSLSKNGLAKKILFKRGSFLKRSRLLNNFFVSKNFFKFFFFKLRDKKPFLSCVFNKAPLLKNFIKRRNSSNMLVIRPFQKLLTKIKHAFMFKKTPYFAKVKRKASKYIKKFFRSFYGKTFVSLKKKKIYLNFSRSRSVKHSRTTSFFILNRSAAYGSQKNKRKTGKKFYSFQKWKPRIKKSYFFSQNLRNNTTIIKSKKNLNVTNVSKHGLYSKSSKFFTFKRLSSLTKEKTLNNVFLKRSLFNVLKFRVDFFLELKKILFFTTKPFLKLKYFWINKKKKLRYDFSYSYLKYYTSCGKSRFFFKKLV